MDWRHDGAAFSVLRLYCVAAPATFPRGKGLGMFQRKSVATITRGLGKMVTDLRKLADESDKEADRYGAEIERMNKERMEVAAEATSARRAASNIEKLTA